MKLQGMRAAMMACAAMNLLALDTAASAQDAAPATAPAAAATPAAAPVPAAAEVASPPTCELHVFPTKNYIVIVSGWEVGLSAIPGLGVLGAAVAGGVVGAIDSAARLTPNQRIALALKTDLSPEQQMLLLDDASLRSALHLSADTRIVREAPLPALDDDNRKDPAAKAEVKQLSARIAAGERLSTSTANCYSELVTTHIFYQRAAMYGTRLFAGWNYRQFTGRPKPVQSAGQVTNPLHDYPARTQEQAAAATAAARTAFKLDFAEWAAKKLKT